MAARGEDAPILALPVAAGCISSPYGERPAGGPRASRNHTGVDLPAPLGAWIGAAAPGRVTAIRRINYSGLEVEVTHAGGLVTRYAHLGDVSPALVEGRREVRAGDRLGRVGRTGITYGTHLHFEVWVRGARVDPAPYLPPLPACGAARASAPPGGAGAGTARAGQAAAGSGSAP